MIERIGRRAAEFVGTTVTRAVRAPAAALGHQPAKSAGRRVAKLALPAAGAAVAVAGVAAGKLRDGLGGSDNAKPTARKRTASAGKPASKATGATKAKGGAGAGAGSAAKGAKRTASKAASKASTANKPKRAAPASNGSSNGHQEKSRDELYELAKKADVPGRSQMSKDELEKALKK